MRLWKLLLIAIVLQPLPALAQDCVDYAPHLRWQSVTIVDFSTQAIGLEGDRAYVVDDDWLSVWDCTDLGAPVRMGGRVAVGYARSIAPHEGHAYVITHSDRLQIVDVSDPASPEVVGTDAPPGSIWAIRIQGSVAYLAGSMGLYILNVHWPSDPFLMSNSVASLDLSTGVDVQDDWAFLADGSGGLRIFDVADPWYPRPVAGLKIGGDVLDVRVDGDWAYLLTDEKGLVVLDVSTPSDPEFVSQVELEDGLPGMGLWNGHVFVRTSHPAFLVVDVRDPLSPAIVNHVSAIASSRGLAVSDGIAGVTMRYHGFALIDAMNPASPPTIGELPTDASARDLAVMGSHAYVARGDSTIQVVDITDPTAPIGGAVLPTRGPARSLDVEGSRLYLADDVGLTILDLANPDLPEVISQLEIPGATRQVVVRRHLAFLTGDNWIFHVVDVGDPYSPRVVGEISLGDWLVDLDVESGLAYVVDHPALGMDIIDVSDPTNPEYLAWFSADNATAVDVEGSYAYLGLDEREEAGPPSLIVVDVSDPMNPVGVSRIHLLDNPRRIQVENGIAYVTNARGGMRLIDVRDPTQPLPLGNMGAAGEGGGLVLADNMALVANGSGGLQIFPKQCPLLVPVLVQDSRHWFEDSMAHLEWVLSDVVSAPELRLTASANGRERLVEVSQPSDWLVQAEDDLSDLDPAATVTYTLEAADGPDRWSQLAVKELTVPPTRSAFALHDAIPNPFNPSTTITYSVPREMEGELVIYDLAGRRVRTLVSGILYPGTKSATWNGTDDSGATVASGVYLYQLRAGEYVETKRTVLLK